MAVINGSGTGTGAEVDTTSTALRVAQYDQNGNPTLKLKNANATATDRLMPIGGLNDGAYRPIRVSRSGAQAQERFTSLVNLNLFTAALPPAWLAPATTFTVAYATATGVQLNAASTGAVSSTASLISMQSIPKYQKSPVITRHRLKITKGSTNGQADWGMFGAQAPGSAILNNGFVWLYGAGSTLKPIYYFNGAAVATGTDIASLITSGNFYVYDIILDDDTCTFICQDPTTGDVISEQVLNINAGSGRQGQFPYFFCGARAFVTSSAANVGTATQITVGDACAYLMDTDTYKPWSHTMASIGNGSVVNPTTVLTQLANWANSAAPASAAPSNATPGYTTLGGQFQFAAAAGAEQDNTLFSFTVPLGLKLIVTGISIDTMNTGAAVATTATLLSWFASVDQVAATLATNSYRVALGMQGFKVGDLIGQQAQQINVTFQTPLVTNSQRFFGINYKQFVGTATASQIIRGTVRVEGYFE